MPGMREASPLEKAKTQAYARPAPAKKRGSSNVCALDEGKTNDQGEFAGAACLQNAKTPSI
jgi:hypothetical protein